MRAFICPLSCESARVNDLAKPHKINLGAHDITDRKQPVLDRRYTLKLSLAGLVGTSSRPCMTSPAAL